MQFLRAAPTSTIQFGGGLVESWLTCSTNDPFETSRRGISSDLFRPDQSSERGASRRPPN
jgi:hypothetical protein